MARKWFGWLLLPLLAAAQTPGAGPVYYVFNHHGGIVGIPAQRGSPTVIQAPFEPGAYGLALDRDGNFIVATARSLMKVSQTGSAAKIADAPVESQFISVAVDGQGNYIVGDNVQHRVLRVSMDGANIAPVAPYPVANLAEMEDSILAIDTAGNYRAHRGRWLNAR